MVGSMRGTVKGASSEDMEKIATYAIEHKINMVEAARLLGFEAKITEITVKSE